MTQQTIGTYTPASAVRKGAGLSQALSSVRPLARTNIFPAETVKSIKCENKGLELQPTNRMDSTNNPFPPGRTSSRG